MPKKKTAKKAAVAKRKAPRRKPSGRKPQVANYISWNSIELENLNPLLQRQFVVGQEIMVARVLLKKGCVVPLHSHHNEQIACVLEGALKFWIGGKEIVVRSGEVLTIPPNMPHKAEAVEDTVDLDIFTPPRADWISKSDRYLREENAGDSKSPRRVG